MIKIKGNKIIIKRRWKQVSGKSCLTGTIKKGELLRVRFNPLLHYKKVIVVSNTDVNKETNSVVVCPILHGQTDSPYHISLNNPDGVNEFISCEHLITLNLSKHRYIRVGYVPGDIMYDIVNLVGLVVGDPEVLT